MVSFAGEGFGVGGQHTLVRDEVCARLSGFVAAQPDAARRLARLREQLNGADDVLSRSNMAGHVTTSAVVLDHVRQRVLMIHHRALDLWLAPGGHYEAPGSLWDSACREVAEETGVTGLLPFVGRQPFLLDIDTHAIPARPQRGEGSHWHHDFAFLAIAPHNVDLALQEEEVVAAQWTPVADLLHSPDERVRRVGDRLAELLR